MKKTLLLLIGIHLGTLLFAQAPLPAFWDFSSNNLPQGFTEQGTSFYTSNLTTCNMPNSCKLDNDGDFVQFFAAGQMGNISFTLRGTGGGNGLFEVQESNDGIMWTTLLTVNDTLNTTDCELFELTQLAAGSRYIRFILINKVSGSNASLDNILIGAPEQYPDIGLLDEGNPLYCGDTIFVSTDSSLTKTTAITIENRGTMDSLVVDLDASSFSMPGFTFESSMPSSFTIPPASAQTLLINFSPTAYKVYESTLNLASNDPDESPFILNLWGLGGAFPDEPSLSPSSLVFENVKSYRFTPKLTFQAGSASGYIVLRNTTGLIDLPQDSVPYSVGEQIGDSKVVSIGLDTTYFPTGLQAGTTYYHRVFPYNGMDTLTNYAQSLPVTAVVSTTNGDQGDYYDLLNLNSVTFPADLSKLIYTNVGVNYGNYGNYLIDYFYKVDTVNGQKTIKDQYTNIDLLYNEPFGWGATAFSREHIMPKSWMPTAPAETTLEYADMHALVPMAAAPNSSRSNLVFDEVEVILSSYGDAIRGTNSEGYSVFEPADNFKGDVARAVLYMVTRYNCIDGNNWGLNHLNEGTSNILQDQNLLKQWHFDDPPSALEIARNDYIDSIQNNRNPFIDHPAWVALLEFDESPCTPKSIEGCAQICVGYDAAYTESYTAVFPYTLDSSSVQWSILPPEPNVTIIGNQTGTTVELDFSNPVPLNDSIILRVTANSFNGIPDSIDIGIKLDRNCVWPGDVNQDGQTLGNIQLNWIGDELALEAAYQEQYQLQNNPNGDSLYAQFRLPGCLAEEIYDWQPQPAEGWFIKKVNDSITPAQFTVYDVDSLAFRSLNLKYADCNGNDTIDATQNWEAFNAPFTTVPLPTDHDIIMYQARNENAHDENSASALLPNDYPESIHIEPISDTVSAGDFLKFKVSLGAAGDTLPGVHKIAFFFDAEFGDYLRPMVNTSNSHLTNGLTGVDIDFPFVENDSLDWYVSVKRPDTLPYSVDYSGQEVCDLIICHITVASFQVGEAAILDSNAYRAVLFQIPVAGIMLEDGRITYVRSKTDTIWVRPNPVLNAKILLEGPYESSTGLMRDDLRESGLLPTQCPYDSLAGYIFTDPMMEGIEAQALVLDTLLEDGIVDWVFIEIYAGNAPCSLLSSRPALLTRQGFVREMDGISPPVLMQLPFGEYYVTIRHRNHLAATWSQTVFLDDQGELLDFSSSQALGTKLLSNDTYVLYAGDLNGNGIIDTSDRALAWNNRNKVGYRLDDGNLSGAVDAYERSIVWNNRNNASAYPCTVD